MLGIIGAMDVEVDEIKKRITSPVILETAGTEFVCGEIEGCSVCAAQCGTGKVNAAVCAQIMIDRFNADSIINLGIGGSLSERVSIKNVVIASEVCQHDIDTTVFGDPLGLIGTLDIVKIEADKAMSDSLEKSARRCCDKVHRGVIASGDSFIASDKLKEKIASQFGAICCEMEGGAVGQVCRLNGVPFAVLRTISDGGNDSELVDYPAFKKSAAELSTAILLDYLKTK